MKVIYPRTNEELEGKSIFLAGTIDNGNSENWQEEIINLYKNDEVTFFNPRRKYWNPLMNSELKDELEYQIKWEQEHLDKADLIIMCLLDNSKSPISLLELGLYAQSKKIIVFCNDLFYRYQNVKLTCDKYGIPLKKFNKSKIKIEIDKFLGKIKGMN